MQDVVEWLKENGNLKVIDEPLDVELEIPHVAYVEVKTDDSRPILFTNPINKEKVLKVTLTGLTPIDEHIENFSMKLHEYEIIHSSGLVLVEGKLFY